MGQRRYKVCTDCHVEKHILDFRRRHRNTVYTHWDTCIDCRRKLGGSHLKIPRSQKEVVWDEPHFGRPELLSMRLIP
jgi:hypothetical protein